MPYTWGCCAAAYCMIAVWVREAKKCATKYREHVSNCFIDCRTNMTVENNCITVPFSSSSSFFKQHGVDRNICCLLIIARQNERYVRVDDVRLD